MTYTGVVGVVVVAGLYFPFLILDVLNTFYSLFTIKGEGDATHSIIAGIAVRAVNFL